MRSNTHNIEPIDTLRLSKQQVDEIVATLIRNQETNPKIKKARAAARVAVHSMGPIYFTTDHEGQNPQRYRAYLWNISRTGAALLHGTFVYAGNRAILTLTQLNGQLIDIPAQIKRCRLINGRIHEVGIHFDVPIELSEFINHIPDEAIDEPKPQPAASSNSLGPIRDTFVRQMPELLEKMNPEDRNADPAIMLRGIEQFRMLSEALGMNELAQAAKALALSQIQNAQAPKVSELYQSLKQLCTAAGGS